MSMEAQGVGWKMAALTDIPPVHPDWPATWKSVRHHLGISGFGINGVSKSTGETLIPDHDETASGQQEVIFVHEGEALVTVEGEQHRAPAGTIIGIEPGVRRKVEAAASPTTLVIVGGAPGKAYEVADWEK
ncbi:MAG: cupin domain-containing protein [Actinobacteria bacterium]|nr:MAG: cupin domain-containing protein [Actinomycetota bacterium]